MLSSERFFIPIVLDGVVELDDKDIKQVAHLLNQLSQHRGEFIYKGNIQKILEQNNFRLIIIKNPETEEIVAMASVHYSTTLRHPDFGKGMVEDVVVDERFRGMGLGDLLAKYVIATARILKIEKLELTSNPTRKAANELYLKHGFKQRDTNCYSLDI